MPFFGKNVSKRLILSAKISFCANCAKCHSISILLKINYMNDFSYVCIKLKFCQCLSVFFSTFIYEMICILFLPYFFLNKLIQFLHSYSPQGGLGGLYYNEKCMPWSMSWSYFALLKR